MRVGQVKGLFGGIAILSASALVLQITLTRLYSALFGHHLAFLALSLSLFGVGLGSVLLYVLPGLARPPALFARLSYLAGLAAAATVVALLYALHAPTSEGDGPAAIAKLAALYFVSALPFVFVGIAVAAGLRHAARDVSRLYLWDLLGASAGCLAAMGALRAGAMRAALIAAILASLAAVVFALASRTADGPTSIGERAARPGLVVTFVLASVVLLVGDLFTPWLKLPNLKYAPSEKVELSVWNEMGLVTVDKPEKGMAWVRIDGSAATAILEPKTAPPLHPDEMAYVLHKDKGPVLVIGSGGGRDLRAALKAGQKDVYAAELNPLIVTDVMRGRYKAFSGELYDKPEVHATVADGRSFVRSSPRTYQSIVLSLVDTSAASSVGALALTEDSLYTTEAFGDFLSHLAPDGTLLVSRWDTEFERLLSLAVAGLSYAGVDDDAASHMFGCGSQRSTSLLVKKSALTKPEIAALRAHCSRNKFDEAFAPDDPHGALRASIAAVGGARAEPQDGKMDLRAPTDDRPFFSYTLPTRQLPAALADWRALEAANQGLLALVAMFVLGTGLAVVFLLGPLAIGRVPVLGAPDRGARLRALLYFLAIGGGFACVEIALVQRFVMFVGHPAYALSAVLLALLLWTGIGSLLTARVAFGDADASARRRAGMLVGLLAAYAVALGPVLRATAALPSGARLAMAIVMLAPLGVLMGSQAPLGVKLVASRAPELIPWCWGLGGVASVIATASGTLLAIHLGWSALLVAGGAGYLVGAIACPPPGALAEPA